MELGFGRSVAVAGDTAIVGAPDSNTGGAAYVFVRSEGMWREQQKLVASGAVGFGGAVAISDDTAIVGTMGRSDTAGTAYVFVREGDLWSQQQRLTASDGRTRDWFGWSVAISGDTAIVGATQPPTAPFGLGSGPGAAYVFVRRRGEWTEQQKLAASDPGSQFGAAVSISGDTAIVGQSCDDYGCPDTSAAYVFARTNAMWTEEGKLIAPGGERCPVYGRSVSVAGDTTIVGAAWDLCDPAEVTDIEDLRGWAYVFVRNDGAWSFQDKFTPSDEGTTFGVSVSIADDVALVGALQADPVDDGGTASGAAYLFKRKGSSWTQWQKLTASDRASGDQFGSSVSVAGDTAIVGTDPFEGDGSAYVFAAQ